MLLTGLIASSLVTLSLAAKASKTSDQEKTIIEPEPTTNLMRKFNMKEVKEIISKWKLPSVGGRPSTLVMTENWRIDLQGDFPDRRKLLPKGKKWMNVQIQRGGEKKYQRRRGESTSVAQIFVPAGQKFTVREFQEAFLKSLPGESHSGYKVWLYKKITPARPSPKQKDRRRG